MGRLLRTLFLLLVALSLVATLTAAADSSDPDTVATAADDVIEEEEEDDVMVEDDEEKSEETVQAPPSEVEQTDEEEEEDEDEDTGLKPSPDVTAMAIFPEHDSLKFPAGEPVEALIGMFLQSDFVVTAIEGSLRYPQDYSYHIQNFTHQFYEQYVAANTSVTFLYPFTPSEMFNSRAFGFTLNIYYKDLEGNEFMSTVFNDTINVVEIDEGFDHYTFFMYVFMITGIFLLMYVIHYVYTTVHRPVKSSTRKPVEMGTQGGKDGVDYDWLPPGTVPTPKKSPHRSPRGRKQPKATNS